MVRISGVLVIRGSNCIENSTKRKSKLSSSWREFESSRAIVTEVIL